MDEDASSILLEENPFSTLKPAEELKVESIQEVTPSKLSYKEVSKEKQKKTKKTKRQKDKKTKRQKDKKKKKKKDSKNKFTILHCLVSCKLLNQCCFEIHKRYK